MKQLLIIIVIATTACKKEPLPEPKPNVYEIKYVVQGDKYTFKYYDIDAEIYVNGGTESEIVFKRHDWKEAHIEAFPDSNTTVKVSIFIDNQLCSSDTVEFNDFTPAKADCIK